MLNGLPGLAQLDQTLAEFDHRYSNRKIADGERTVNSLVKAEGKRLTYKSPKANK